MNRKITAAFFSPTGGTKRAVEKLCACWGGEVNWVQLGTKEPVQINLGADELLVLGLPVYAGVIPQVPGLLDGLKGENTPCVLAAAYGNRNYDDALAQMKRLMEERGFLCVGAAAVVTPHIFAPTLGAGRPDEEDRAVLADFARQVEQKLAAGDWMPAQVPGNPTPKEKRPIPVQKDRDWDICLGCGFCAQVCPTGAMDPSSLLWDDQKCISCMACVSHCPVGALGYNSSVLASRLTEKFSQRRPVEIFL